MADHQPIRSCVRGPGDIVGDDAAKIRNSLSNTQTSCKKRKIQVEAAENCGIGLVNVAQVVGGSGLVKAGLVDSRHKLGVKGKPLGPNVRRKVDKIFRAEAADGEVLCQRVMTKYQVGPNSPEGTNLSPRQYTSKQCAVLGFKRALTFDMEPARAIRLADYGVNMVNMVTLELQNQINADWVAAGSPLPAPGPPTEDNIKAAIQMSLILAFENANRPQNLRVGVTKDAANINDVV